MICNLDPDLLLLGTSEPEDPAIGRLESCFTFEAHNIGKPSVAILDHWCGYLDRFSLTARLDAIPDVVCVMDQRAKLELTQLGCPPERIVVTGNPDWDRLGGIRHDLAVLDRGRIRSDLGVDESDRLIVFVSQPLSSESGGNRSYSEIDVLDQIVAAIGDDDRFGSTHMLIKPHGRERVGKFDRFVAASPGWVRLVGPDIDAYALGKASEAAIGMFSMLLVEYSLLGFNAISYQPGPADETVSLGYGVRSIEQLEQLWDFVALPPAPQPARDPRATSTIIEILNRVIEDDAPSRGVKVGPKTKANDREEPLG